jgi:hypothetical protein
MALSLFAGSRSMPAAMLALWGEIVRGRRASLFPAKQMRGLLIFSDRGGNAAPMFHAEQTGGRNLH